MGAFDMVELRLNLVEVRLVESQAFAFDFPLACYLFDNEFRVTMYPDSFYSKADCCLQPDEASFVFCGVICRFKVKFDGYGCMWRIPSGEISNAPMPHPRRLEAPSKYRFHIYSWITRISSLGKLQVSVPLSSVTGLSARKSDMALYYNDSW